MIRPIKKPKADPLAAIDAAREQVAKIKGDLAQAEAANRARADVERMIAEGLDRLADGARGVFRVGHLMPADGDAGFHPHLEPHDLAALLISLNRAGIEAMIARDLDDLYGGDEGLAEAERKAKIAKLEADLIAAEMADEMAVREAEAAGFEVVRRGDADPRAVLAA